MDNQIRYSPCDIVSANELPAFIERAKDFAALEGLLMYDVANTKKVVIPHTLFPSPLFREYAKEMEQLQLDFNLLFHTVSQDHEFLEAALKTSVEGDTFTASLWNIYTTVRGEGIAQPICLGMNRSDYMMHYGDNVGMKAVEVNRYGSLPVLLEPPKLKQVEFNLMASSFAGLASRIGKQHRLTMNIAGVSEEVLRDNLPINRPVLGLAKGLYTAWLKYNNPKAGILFVVGVNESNIFDQRCLEKCLYKKCHPQLKVLRRTFDQLESSASLDESKTLFVDDLEIAVVYFRHGYAPHHFPSQKVWDTKLLLERSRAIKCPCIQYMLANTKMIQKSLADEEVIRHYANQLQVDFVDRLLGCFVGMYDLDHKEAVKQALERPDHFVLKPQREGGGNNLFDDELLQKLKFFQHEENRIEAGQYILMRRLYPVRHNNYILRESNTPVKTALVSELGAFGVFIGKDKDILANYFCGYLVRSKEAECNEGGIAAGFGCLDSPFLIDMQHDVDGFYHHTTPFLP